MKTRGWPQERIETLKRLHAEGHTLPKIAEAMDVPLTTLRWYCRKHNLSRGNQYYRRVPTDEEREWLRLNYRYVRLEICAIKLDCSRRTAWRMAHSLGLTKRKKEKLV